MTRAINPIPSAGAVSPPAPVEAARCSKCALPRGPVHACPTQRVIVRYVGETEVHDVYSLGSGYVGEAFL